MPNFDSADNKALYSEWLKYCTLHFIVLTNYSLFTQIVNYFSFSCTILHLLRAVPFKSTWEGVNTIFFIFLLVVGVKPYFFMLGGFFFYWWGGLK